MRVKHEKTVEDGFLTFHGILIPTREESQSAERHKTFIKACLQKDLGMQCFPTGSFRNGTSIRCYSDVDYFICVSPEHLTLHSFTTLREIQKILSVHLPTIAISLEEPAIVLHVGDKISSVDIVPARLTKRKVEDQLIYEIANGNGGWQLYSPDIHSKYVDEIDRRFDGKVRHLVRFLKAWKYYCNAPIKSFYLEIFVANYASQKKSIQYSKDVKNILSSLWNIQLADLRDPKGISEPTQPCLSEEQKVDALRKLKIALERAYKACEAENKGDINSAFHWWNLVFTRNFPSYY